MNLKKAFSCQASKERRLKMLAENKKSRVPGKPRNFIDCYLDEMDKVCVPFCKLEELINQNITGCKDILTAVARTALQITSLFKSSLFKFSFSCLPAKRGDDGSSFSEEQLCALILDLHFAGTDTTANTTLSALLYLMIYPQIQGVYTYHLSAFTLFNLASGNAICVSLLAGWSARQNY